MADPTSGGGINLWDVVMGTWGAVVTIGLALIGRANSLKDKEDNNLMKRLESFSADLEKAKDKIDLHDRRVDDLYPRKTEVDQRLDELEKRLNLTLEAKLSPIGAALNTISQAVVKIEQIVERRNSER